MTRTVKIRKLTAKLLLARRRVRALERLLCLAEREAAARCEHVFVMEFPSGMRDNGEYWYRCSKCGSTC